MNIFKSLFGTKKQITNSHDFFTAFHSGGGQSSSGVNVSPKSALECVPFFASVRTLSETMAQLPWLLYEKTGENSRKQAVNHPLYSILKDSPNDYQTSFDFRQELITHALTHDHAFIFINRLSTGEVHELHLLDPSCVTIEKENFVVKYRYQDEGDEKIYSTEQVMRVSGFPGTLNPNQGNMINMLRESVGLAKAAEVSGAVFFKNGGRPGGILAHPETLSKEAKENIAAGWNSAYSGQGANKTAVVDEGMEYKTITHTAEESQFNETRKLQRSEISGALGVPPHKIGDLERSTFSNIEHQSLEFVINSVLPWAKRIEQAVSKYLLTKQERTKYYSEFLVDGLLRGDIETRYNAYQIAISYGILTPNEVRKKENLNPRSDDYGDSYYYPANILPTDEDLRLFEEEDIDNEPLEDNEKLKMVK